MDYVCKRLNPPIFIACCKIFFRNVGRESDGALLGESARGRGAAGVHDGYMLSEQETGGMDGEAATADLEVVRQEMINHLL